MPVEVEPLTRNEIPANQHTPFHLVPCSTEDFEPDGTVRQVDRIPFPDCLRQVRIRDRNLALGPGGFGCQRYIVEPFQMHGLGREFSDSELRTRQILKDSHWTA